MKSVPEARADLDKSLESIGLKAVPLNYELDLAAIVERVAKAQRYACAQRMIEHNKGTSVRDLVSGTRLVTLSDLK